MQVGRISSKLNSKPLGGALLDSKVQVSWYDLALVLFPILAWGLYHGVLHGPFVFDDLAQIKENYPLHVKEFGFVNVLEGLRTSRLSGRFVANFSFMLNYWFGGLDTYGFHIVNIGVHAVTGILVFYFLRITLLLPTTSLGDVSRNRASMIAFWTALLWLVHPLATQTTSYIVQRMNGLSSLFYIGGLLCYIHGRIRRRKLLFALCGLCFILSVGSKEIGVTLPVVILLYEWYFFQDLSSTWVKRGLPWLVAAFLFVFAFGFVLFDLHPLAGIADYYRIRDFNVMERILTQLRVVWFYVSLILFPHPGRLNLEHDFPLSHSLFDPLSTFFSFVSLLALLGFAVGIAKKHRLFSFCILWFFITLALESSFIPLELVFEHRTYLPSIMLVLAVVLLIFRASRNSKTACILCVCLALFLCLGTLQRNQVWADQFALMSDCLKKSPHKYRVLYNYAKALSDDRVGRYGEAIVYYRRALEKDPENDKAHNNLGVLLARQGMVHQGLKHLHKSLELQPANHKAHLNLGQVLLDAGETVQAMACFEKALALEPRYAPALHNLGLAYEAMGDRKKAAGYMEEALVLAPGDLRGQYNYALLMNKMGEKGVALRHFRMAMDLAQKQGLKDFAAQARAALAELEGQS
ncbi:MAG: tetratricopeptide repeat protein [Desulfatibacillum sp.]|nr:tetratricopeptide repeat protein [Desulfatibacillum sp.]